MRVAPKVMNRGQRIWHQLGQLVQEHPKSALVLATLFGFMSSFLTVGWIQPDEHARVLEAAHQLVYGFASLPWELRPPQPIVSYLLGSIHAPILWIAHQFSEDGLLQAALLRSFSAFMATFRFVLFWQILSALGLRRERFGLYSVIYALSPFTLLLISRTSQENWGTTALMACLWSSLQALKSPAKLEEATKKDSGSHLPRHWHFFGVGVFASLATSFRLQLGPSCLGLGLWLLYRARRHPGLWMSVLSLTFGAIIGLLPMAIVDTWTVGKPFLPAWNYLKYALSDEDGADSWGKSSWITYLSGFLTVWYPPFSLPILAMIVWGCWLAAGLGAIVLPNILVHVFLSHKELRYLSPLLPFWTLAAFLAWEYLEVRGKFFHRERMMGLLRWLSPYAGLVAALNLIAATIVINPQPFFYAEVRHRLEEGKIANGFIFAATSRTGLSEFYFKHPEAQPKVKISESKFFQLLALGLLPESDYALQRIRYHHLPLVQRHCKIVYNSIPPWQLKIYEWAGERLKHRYFDAIAHCQSRPF